MVHMHTKAFCDSASKHDPVSTNVNVSHFQNILVYTEQSRRTKIEQIYWRIKNTIDWQLVQRHGQLPLTCNADATLDALRR